MNEMVFTIDQYIKDILDRLSWLSSRIEIGGLQNLLDCHVCSEDFFAGLLNNIFELNLQNANFSVQNQSGIDLIDKTNKIFIQVTGDCSKTKIDHSLAELQKSDTDKNARDEFNGYHFYFLPIVNQSKTQRKHSYDIPTGIIFSPATDIYDINTIVNIIRKKSVGNFEYLKTIRNFVCNCIKLEVEPSRIASGLTTIISLLSQDYDDSVEAFDTIDFKIESKIMFNDLKYGKDIIDEYKKDYIRVKNIYDEYSKQGKNKSRSVIQKLKSFYFELKQEKHSDDLFKALTEKLISESSELETQCSPEEIEMCVHMLLTHAFMECIIFEKPIENVTA